MKPIFKAASLAAAALLVVLSACDRQKERPLPKGTPIPSEGIYLRPESERFLDHFIIGLDPYGSRYFELPLLESNPGVSEADWLESKRQLYWLNFELSHGGLMRLLPRHTQIFVAVPERKGGKSSEQEPALFMSYLRERCGWSKKEVQDRVHFFYTPNPLIWMQDSGEILGYDSERRKVIRIDAKGRPEYKKTIEALVKAYPQIWQLKVTNEGVRAEGGDEELVWRPDGGLGVIAGKNRVISYLEEKHPGFRRDQDVPQDWLEEARGSFSDTFYRLPVSFIPEKIVKKPSLGSEELFHLDMIVSVMRNDQGLHAFVPTYLDDAADAVMGQPLPAGLKEACQKEFDICADQMGRDGYTVLRLPFADHPARSPVNIVKFYSEEEKRYVVYLARYPSHLPLSDSSNPQKRLQARLWALQDEGVLFNGANGQKSLQPFRDRLKDVWDTMDEVSRAANPVYAMQEKIFRDAGYHVIPVPIYATGSGGLHCMVLR